MSVPNIDSINSEHDIRRAFQEIYSDLGDKPFRSKIDVIPMEDGAALIHTEDGLSLRETFRGVMVLFSSDAAEDLCDAAFEIIARENVTTKSLEEMVTRYINHEGSIIQMEREQASNRITPAISRGW